MLILFIFSKNQLLVLLIFSIFYSLFDLFLSSFYFLFSSNFGLICYFFNWIGPPAILQFFHLYLIPIGQALQIPPVICLRRDPSGPPSKCLTTWMKLNVHLGFFLSYWSNCRCGEPFRCRGCADLGGVGDCKVQLFLLPWSFLSRRVLRHHSVSGDFHTGVLSVNSCWIIFT